MLFGFRLVLVLLRCFSFQFLRVQTTACAGCTVSSGTSRPGAVTLENRSSSSSLIHLMPNFFMLSLEPTSVWGNWPFLRKMMLKHIPATPKPMSTNAARNTFMSVIFYILQIYNKKTILAEPTIYGDMPKSGPASNYITN